MTPRHSDQDPDEGDGQFNVRGRNRSENKPRRRGSEDGGNDRMYGRGNRGRGRREGPYSVGGSPGPTEMEIAIRAGGVKIPTREEINSPPAETDHQVPERVEPPVEHSAPTAAPVVEVAPPPAAEVATPVTGLTPEPATPVSHKEETVMTAPEGLPNLEVKTLTPEELAAAAKEAEQRRTWAENAGKTLATLETDKARIEADPNLEMSPTLKGRLATIIEQIAKIRGVQDEGIKAHAEFSELYNAIKTAATGQAQTMLDRALRAGRVKEGNVGWVINYRGKHYIAADGSDGTKAIFSELKKLVEKTRAENRAAWTQGLEELKFRATPGLTLYVIGEGEARDPVPATGHVYAHIPEKRMDDGRTLRESHLLIEVRTQKGREGEFPVIVPVKAMGYYGRLFDELSALKPVPFLAVSMFRRPHQDVEQALVKNLGEDTGKKVYAFLRAMRTALYVERDAVRAEEAKAKAAVPAVVVAEAPTPAPTETTPVVAESGKANEEAPSPSPAPAPEIKRPRTKKPKSETATTENEGKGEANAS